MCKYCNETLYRTCEYDDEEMFKSVEKKFCAECGTPLGEVNPLTVEQLKQMDDKPVYVVDKNRNEKLWCIISIFKSKFSAEIAGCDHFWYEEKDYGTTWIAYTQEPKGEAE